MRRKGWRNDDRWTNNSDEKATREKGEKEMKT
jgi:hypothetical protein